MSSTPRKMPSVPNYDPLDIFRARHKLPERLTAGLILQMMFDGALHFYYNQDQTGKFITYDLECESEIDHAIVLRDLNGILNDVIEMFEKQGFKFTYVHNMICGRDESQCTILANVNTKIKFSMHVSMTLSTKTVLNLRLWTSRTGPSPPGSNHTILSVDSVLNVHKTVSSYEKTFFQQSVEWKYEECSEEKRSAAVEDSYKDLKRKIEEIESGHGLDDT